MDPAVGHCEDGHLCVCEQPIPSTQRCKLRGYSETYPHAIEPKSVISTPVTNHRKRRLNKEKSTNVKKQRRKLASTPKDKSSLPNKDVFNMSLPIQKSTSACDNVKNEEEKSLSDSDGDLPVGLAPVQLKKFPIAIEPNSLSSSPVTNHRKRRMIKEKKTNVKKQRRKSESTSKDDPSQTNDDVLNMSLPTPKSTSSCEYVENEEETSISDSDGDLPVGLAPVTLSNTIKEGDLVWVKWNSPPYLPAVVRHLYKRKKRVTLFLFYPRDEPQKPYSMTIVKKDRIFPYFDPRRTEIMNNSKGLPSKDLQYFKACVQRLEEFLMKKALKEFKNEWSFFGDEDEEVMAELRKETKPVTGIKDRHGPLTENKMSESDKVSEKEPEKEPVREFKGLSKKGLLRKERLKEKTKDLTEFLISDDCKEYLFKIFKKEVKSELHQVIIGGTVKERRNIKHKGFGPIDDEDQIDSILTTYHSWLGEVNRSPYLHKNDYVFDCWVPEAIVYGLKKIRKYSTKKAWEMFYKGVKCSKEELKIFIDEFLGTTDGKKAS